MSKKNIVTIILSVVAIIISAVCLGLIFTHTPSAPEAPKAPEAPAVTENQDVQYVLYLGTNDKDTNQPVFSQEESMEKAKEILISHFGGYTIQEANGGWKDDESGKVYQEYTLVIYLSDTSLDEVHKAAAELVDVFHQSSVLIQANQTTTEFYSGS